MEVLSLLELEEGLNSNDVEVLFNTLDSFSRTCSNILRGVVDYEISKEADLLSAYLLKFPESPHLFRIWNFQQERKITRIEGIIINTLTRLINVIKVYDDKYISTGIYLCKNIIKKDLVALYRNLSNNVIPLIQSSLKLLVAIATFHPSIVKDLQENFNFGMKALIPLFKYRKKPIVSEDNMRKSVLEDVRTLYIKFICAFLKFGDCNVKKNVLETKDLVSGVFKGLIDDVYEVVEEFFDVLKEHVIDDGTLKRNVKISFFNNYILEFITKLYTRNNYSDIYSIPIATSLSPANPTVAFLTHKFLLYLCTIPGTGICFQDAGWYLPVKNFYILKQGNEEVTSKSPRVYNSTLLRLIRSLSPADNEYHQELLLKILESCPELVQPYWMSSTLSFDPRLSERWAANMALCTKVIQLPVPKNFSMGSNSAHTANVFLQGSSPPPVFIVADNIIPPTLNKSLLTKCLSHSNSTVKYITITVLNECFQKFTSVKTEFYSSCSVACGDTETNSTIYLEWEKFLQGVQEEVWRRMPDVQMIIAIQHQEAGKQSTFFKAKSIVAEPMDGNLENEDDQVFLVSLKLLANYKMHFSNSLLESRFDHGKLLNLNLLEISSDIQLEILKLLDGVVDLNWWKKSTFSNFSCIGSILNLYVNTNNKAVVALIEKIIKCYLSESFIFNQNSSEVHIWITILRSYPSLITLFDETICSLYKDPYSAIDKLSILSSNVADTLSKEEKDATNHLQYIKNLIENRKITNPSFPFSLLTVEFFMVLMEKDDLVLGKFVGSVFSEVLIQTQTSGRYFVELIKSFKIPISVVDNDPHALCRELSAKRNWSAKDYVRSFYLKTTLYLNLGHFCQPNHPKNVLNSKDCEIDSMTIHELNFFLLNILQRQDQHFSVANFILNRNPESGSIFTFYKDFSNFIFNNDQTIEIVSEFLSKFSLHFLISNFFSMFKFSKQNIDSVVKSSNFRNLIFKKLDEIHFDGAFNLISLIFFELNHINRIQCNLNLIFDFIINIFENCLILYKLQLEKFVVLKQYILLNPIFLNNFADEGDWFDLDSAEKFAYFIKKIIIIESGSFVKACVSWTAYIKHAKRMILHSLNELATSKVNIFKHLAIIKCYINFFTTEDLNEIIASIKCCLKSPKHYTIIEELIILILSHKKSFSLDLEFIALLTKSYFAAEACSSKFELIIYRLLESNLSFSNRNYVRILHSEPNCFHADLSIVFEDHCILFLINNFTEYRGKVLGLFIKYFYLIRNFVMNWIMKNMQRKLEKLLIFEILDSVIYCVAEEKNNKTIFKSTATKIELDVVSYLVDCVSEDFQNHLVRVDLSFDNSSYLLIAKVMVLFAGKFNSKELTKKLFNNTANINITSMEECLNCLKNYLKIAKVYNLVIPNSKVSTAALAYILLNGMKLLESAYSIIKSEGKTTLDDRNDVLPKSLTDDINFIIKDVLYSLNMVVNVMKKKKVLKICKSLFASDLERQTVKKLVLRILKNRFLDNDALSFLTSILDFSFQFTRNVIFTPDTLVEMILTHSQFQNLDTNDKVKSVVLNLVLSTMKKNPILTCKSTIIPILISSYNFTTSDSDLTLMKIFVLFEREVGASCLPFVLHQSSPKKPLGSIYIDFFANLDSNLMLKSLKNFDLNATVCEDFDFMNKEVLYDANFILPFICHVIDADNENKLDFKQLIQSNSVGLCVVTLSSLDSNMRKIGYFTLDKVFVALKKVNFKECNQVLVLLNNFRNAITDRNTPQSIPSISTIFVAESLTILVKPDSFMYTDINRFLLQRPVFPLDELPLFYNLFYSNSVACKKERSWILKLIDDGLKCRRDFDLCQKRHALDILLGFFESPLSDLHCRKLVLQILFNVASIKSAVADMVAHHGLWVYFQSCAGTIELKHENPLALSFLQILHRCFINWNNAENNWHGRFGKKNWLDSFTSIVAVLVNRFEQIIESCNFSSIVSIQKTWILNYFVLLLKILHNLFNAYRADPELGINSVIVKYLSSFITVIKSLGFDENYGKIIDISKVDGFLSSKENLFTLFSDEEILLKFISNYTFKLIVENDSFIQRSFFTRKANNIGNLGLLIKWSQSYIQICNTREFNYTLSICWLKWLLKLQVERPGVIENALIEGEDLQHFSALIHTLFCCSHFSNSLFSNLSVINLVFLSCANKNSNSLKRPFHQDEFAQDGLSALCKQVLQLLPTPAELFKEEVLLTNEQQLILDYLKEILRIVWGGGLVTRNVLFQSRFKELCKENLQKNVFMHFSRYLDCIATS